MLLTWKKTVMDIYLIRRYNSVAEFCKECFLQMNEGEEWLEDKQIVVSQELDLCEGCGEWKEVVVEIK